MEKLILIGAGGYAKSVLDSVDKFNFKMVGFLDEYKPIGEHLGYRILGNSLDDIVEPEKYFYFISIGNNHERQKWYDRLKKRNLRMINVIDHTAIVSEHAEIGISCFIGKMAIVNSCAKIGNNCIVNTKALVEHGASTEDHVNLSTNSVINGDVSVKSGAFVGSCSVVSGQLTVGSWAVVGAGAVVVRDVPDEMTVVGVPAKDIQLRRKA